ncbi:MAG: methyltransferase domain-containing protein [Caldilineaceae bacterium]
MNPYHKLPPTQLLHGRFDFLIEVSRGKRVLHLGCVDTGLLEERFRRGELLHQKLDAVATELWGMDINQTGIEFLQKAGFDRLFACDVEQIDQIDALRQQRFDVILASEIVEHLLNPGLFFTSIAKLMTPEHTRLIVTVPDAFRVSTLMWLTRGVEYVHPDHNFWFSYVTLNNLLQKTGYTTEAFYTYSSVGRSLLPRRFRRQPDQLAYSQQATPVAKEADLPLSDPPSTLSFPAKVFTYFSNLPKVTFINLMLRFSPYFGDGLIAVAKRSHAL